MKKISLPVSGKILTHARGTGLSGRADLAARAREIALINKHTTPTDDDRTEAERELAGQDLPTSEQDSTSSRGLTRDPSEPISNFGSEKPTGETPDEQNVSERLVVEGVEEAQHDQMLASRRQRKS